MSFFFTEAAKKIADGTIIINSGHKLKVAVVTTASECNTNASSAQDRATMSAITPLGESAATGYARQAIGVTLTPTTDTSTNSTTWTTATTNSWSVTGSEYMGGFLIYYDADDDLNPAEDASNIPVAYINNSPINGTLFNGTITVTWTSLLKAIAQ